MFFYPFSLSLWSSSFNKLCICIVNLLFKPISIIEYRAWRQNHCCIWKDRKYSWCLVISAVMVASCTFPWEPNMFSEPLPFFNPVKHTITFSTPAGAFYPPSWLLWPPALTQQNRRDSAWLQTPPEARRDAELAFLANQLSYSAEVAASHRIHFPHFLFLVPCE